MTEEIKFEQDELDKINEFQQRYLDIQMGFGQVDLARLRLEKQEDDLITAEEALKDQYEQTQQEEQEFIKELNQKYGPGTLDPQSGRFTPNIPEINNKSKEN